MSEEELIDLIEESGPDLYCRRKDVIYEIINVMMVGGSLYYAIRERNRPQILFILGSHWFRSRL